MTKNLYDVLGVDAGASPEQLQSAYIYWAKRMSQRQAEPPNREALDELQSAYSVLARPDQRAAYDARTQRGVSQRAEKFRAVPKAEEPTRTVPAARYSIRESFDSVHPSFEELFDRLWSNFSGVSRPKAEGLERLTLEIPLTSDQALGGGNVEILIPVRAECPACSGHGALGAYQCWKCGGHGSITGDYPLALAYPPGVTNEYIVQVPLSSLGINNFYLTVRFRVTDEV